MYNMLYIEWLCGAKPGLVRWNSGIVESWVRNRLWSVCMRVCFVCCPWSLSISIKCQKRFRNLTMAVFQVVMLCSVKEFSWRFRVVCCLHHQGDRPNDGCSKNLWNIPDDGGSKYLWKVEKLLSDYLVQQSRRPPSSETPPWGPENSLRFESC